MEERKGGETRAEDEKRGEESMRQRERERVQDETGMNVCVCACV